MSPAPAILGIGTSNPKRRYTQQQLYDLAAKQVPFYRSERVRQIFMNSDIDYRHLAFDIDTFNPNETVDDLHERFRTYAIEIGREAIVKCLQLANIAVSYIDYIIGVSCSGYLCPGLSSLLVKDLGMRNLNPVKGDHACDGTGVGAGSGAREVVNTPSVGSIFLGLVNTPFHRIFTC